MNTPDAIKQMELAAWEMAEAETHERMAKSLRLKSAKRIAAIHFELKSALESAIKNQTKKKSA